MSIKSGMNLKEGIKNLNSARASAGFNLNDFRLYSAQLLFKDEANPAILFIGKTLSF